MIAAALLFERRFLQLANLGFTLKACTLLHGEGGRGDVAVDASLAVEMAALAGDVAIDLAVDLYFASIDVAFDLGLVTDGDFARVGVDLSIDVAINVHVCLEANRANNFDALSEDICG